MGSEKSWQQWTNFSVHRFSLSWQSLRHQYHMLVQQYLRCNGSQQKYYLLTGASPHFGECLQRVMVSTAVLHLIFVSFYSTVLEKPDNKCLLFNLFLHCIILVHITKIYTVLMSITVRSKNLHHDFWQVCSYNNFVCTSFAPAIQEYQNHW